MFAQIFDKLISDSESVRTMFDQLFEFSIRHVQIINAVTGRDDSSDISVEQLRSEKPTEPISYCPGFSIYTWDVEKVLKHIHKVFTEHKYPIYTFPLYLETHVEEIIKVGISEKPSNICLAALKFISVNPYHVALRTLDVDTEVFRESISKCEHLEEILDVMISFNTKLMGAGESFKDKFIHALQQIIKLQNTWEYIKICNISNKLEGDKSISEDRLFDIYGGDYLQIPKSSKIIDVDIDMSNITQTNDKKINSFIYQNFNRFCNLLESYGKTVYKVLNNSNEKDFTKEIGMYNSKLDYYNLNNKSLMKMFAHVSSIKDKHIVYGLKDVVDVIIYNYVPELRKLKFNKYFDESLAISMITSGSNSMLLGVALYIPSVKINDQRTIQEEQPIKNKVITGGNTETDGVNSEILSLVSKFNEHSLSFVNSFLTNYKKIIEKLEGINWNTLKVKADTKYKNSFVLLRKLLIKKPETLGKLIDIDENENFNYDYTKACNEFVSFVRNNQLSIYSNITDEVERISELLSDIHKKAISFRNDTFNIKKNKIDFDYLSMCTIKLQRELNLKVKGEFDKEKFEEKINKIIKYTLSSISSLEYPYDISKNKEKLEEYLSKIKDRESTIKEYFENLKHDCKYSYQQLSPRVKNLVIIFCNMYNSLVSEYEKSYLWLNNEFDKFITKDRIKQMDKITLTSEQIKSIVSAAEQIDKYKPLNNIAEQFDNYVSSMMGANVTDFYKCYQFIRNAYEEIGVLNYIEIIYKTLNIVDTSSKEWYIFKSNLLNFLTINSIWFDIYKLDGDKYVLGSKSMITDENSVMKNARFRELPENSNNYEFFNIINNIFSNKFIDNNNNYDDTTNQFKFPLTPDNIKTIKQNIITDKFNKTNCCDFIRFLFEVIENMCINGKDSKFKFGYAINDKSIFKPFNKELDTRIFKALYVPIFQKINKYIILNKSEDDTIFDDKIMLTMLGGAKQYGSSLYDYSEPHKVEEVKFIEEYLPVYVSCYTIINYYVSYLNDLMKNSKLLSIDTLFKCSILSSIIDKTPEEFKVKKINVMNVDNYLKFINDICSKNKKKDTDLTKFAIESISSEFNSLLTLSKSLKPNELKSVDLYSEFDNLTNITDDIKNIIQKMRELYINNGFNYSVEYKNIIQRLKDEMRVTSDKKAFFINCIEKLDGKHTNDSFNTKKVFMDLYYVPIEIIANFWVKKISEISTIKGANGVQDILYKLYLLYGNKYHSLKELYTCVFDEFYKDLDESIHHVINYANFNDKAIEKTQAVHNKIKNLATEIKTEIDQKFGNTEYKINDKMIPYIPFIGNTIVKKYNKNIYMIDKNIGAIGHSISFDSGLSLERITITDMIVNFISSITQENTIPLKMVELLKNSELNNNTFKLFPMSDKPLFWKNVFTDKGNVFQYDIVGAFSSVIIHKSLYNNDLGTDINSQVYCNKLLSIINFSIQTLETILNSLIPGREYYNGYVHNIDKEIDDGGNSRYIQINSDTDGIIVPKINARKEISILINILKELYSYYAPRAKECEFLGGNVLTPNHYIVELIQLIDKDSDSFKLHFMNNVEKYQWVIPTIKKIDYDVRYNDPFEKYFKNINNMDKLIEKKDHMHIMKILAKLILYKFLDIDNLFVIDREQQINSALSGGDIKFTSELSDNYEFEDTDINANVDGDNKNTISISKDVFNPIQYVLNDKVVMDKLNIKSDKDELLFGDNEYITSKVSQIIESDDTYGVKRINIKCNKVVDLATLANKCMIVKFNNGIKRTYYHDNSDRHNTIYEILFDYNIDSEKIEEVAKENSKVNGEYKYNYKNIKDLYEYIKSNGNTLNEDYEEFINNLVKNKEITIDNYKFGLKKITDNSKTDYEYLYNVFDINDPIFDKTMMDKLAQDKLILEAINKRKLWLVAICVLMLYSYYGVWKTDLVDNLIVLSNKIIKLYNDKYINSKPYMFINELIKNKFIHYSYKNNNIDILTYDLIELDTYYIPEISRMITSNIENKLLMNRIDKVILNDEDADIVTMYINLIDIVLGFKNKIKDYINISLVTIGPFAPLPILTSIDDHKYTKSITISKPNDYIYFNSTKADYDGKASDINKYVYDNLIDLLTNAGNKSNEIYIRYVSIKMLYKIYIIFYCIMLNNIVEEETYNDVIKSTKLIFKTFNNVISKYKYMMKYRTDSINDESIQDLIRNTKIKDKIDFIDSIYNIFKNNINKIEFNTKLINKHNNIIIDIDLNDMYHTNNNNYFNITHLVTPQERNNFNRQIQDINKHYKEIKNNEKITNNEKINIKFNGFGLMINNNDDNDDINDVSYDQFNELIFDLLNNNNVCDVYITLYEIIKAKTIAELEPIKYFNDPMKPALNPVGKESKNIIEIYKTIKIYMERTVKNSNDELFRRLKENCKLIFDAINTVLNITLNYMISNISKILINSRELCGFFSCSIKDGVIPLDNIYNANYNIALDNIYTYLNSLELNNISKSINNINKSIFTLMKDSQIEMAKKKMNILLSSPKHIKSLKNIINRKVINKINNMYTNVNLSLINIDENIRGSLNNKITDINARNKNFKDYYSSKWYLRGLSNNNIVIKTMIEILLECMDLNIYHTTYQLHPFNNNIPLIPFGTLTMNNKPTQNERDTLIYRLGDTYCDNNTYYAKNSIMNYKKFKENIAMPIKSSYLKVLLIIDNFIQLMIKQIKDAIIATTIDKAIEEYIERIENVVKDLYNIAKTDKNTDNIITRDVMEIIGDVMIDTLNDYDTDGKDLDDIKDYVNLYIRNDIVDICKQKVEFYLYENTNSCKTLLLSIYLMMTYENTNNNEQIRIIDNMKPTNDNTDIFDKLLNYYKLDNISDESVGEIVEKNIYNTDKLNQIANILLIENMSGGDLVLEDPNTILEKFANEKHTIFDKYIFRYHSNIKNVILGHFANVLASYSNYLSGLTYYQILYSSEVFDTFVKSIRETFKNNNVKVQNSEISCIYHVINSLLSDELTERVKLPMISSVNTIGNENNNSNFIQDNIIYPFINKRKFFDMKSKDETLLSKLTEYDSKCLIDKMVDIEFYNMAVNCILIYIIKYVYKNKLEDDTINYIDSEVSL